VAGEPRQFGCGFYGGIFKFFFGGTGFFPRGLGQIPQSILELAHGCRSRQATDESTDYMLPGGITFGKYSQ
jgi:hypothetical protein